MELAIQKQDGSVGEMIKFLEGFEPPQKPKELLHEIVLHYLSNQRQGTSSAKTRAEVSGSGKKPWKQKGTGRARAGSIRSPLWRHGGVVFAPKPRDYSYVMPKKKKRLALFTALYQKHQDAQVVIVDSIDTALAKTKDVVSWAASYGFDKKTIVVMRENNPLFERASRNIPKFVVTLASKLNAYDVLWADTIVCMKDAIEYLNEKVKVKV